MVKVDRTFAAFPNGSHERDNVIGISQVQGYEG